MAKTIEGKQKHFSSRLVNPMFSTSPKQVHLANETSSIDSNRVKTYSCLAIPRKKHVVHTGNTGPWAPKRTDQYQIKIAMAMTEATSTKKATSLLHRLPGFLSVRSFLHWSRFLVFSKSRSVFAGPASTATCLCLTLAGVATCLTHRAGFKNPLGILISQRVYQKNTKTKTSHTDIIEVPLLSYHIG